MSFATLMKNFGMAVAEGVSKHSATISAITTITSIAGSIYFSYKARPVVDKIMLEERAKRQELDDIREKGGVEEDEYKKLKKAITCETVKRLAPPIIPIVICSTVGTGLSIRSAVVSKKKDKQIHSLESLATVIGTSANEFISKSKEIIGEDKVKEIENAVAKDRAEKVEKKPSESGDITVVGAIQAKGGDRPFYDKLGARVILSDKKTIKQVVDQMNTEMSYAIIPSPSVTYQRFCDLMKLPAPSYADCVVWTKDRPSDRLEVNLRNTMELDDVTMNIIDWSDIPEIKTNVGKVW